MRFFGQIIFSGIFCLLLASCIPGSSNYDGTGDLRLRPVTYSSLPGWNADGHASALASFLVSCGPISRQSARENFGPTPAFGRVGKWQAICRRAQRVRTTDQAAKIFFENSFEPYAVGGTGTFTGYYEVAVRGSRSRRGAYQFPVYGTPSDLQHPYYSRAQIDSGALAGRGLEILYLASVADVFLLHVQGSGAISLPDGSVTRVSFSGHNGRGFKSISSAMRAAGYNSEIEGATMLDYRRWLNQNPRQAVSIIQANPRYIFFAEHNNSGPLGALGVPLTPGRSLAIDKSYIGLGTPIYLNTYFADPDANDDPTRLRRLVIAQDTGSAIKGPVRGDFYWGTGEEALKYAGRMKEQGSYTLLLPR